MPCEHWRQKTFDHQVHRADIDSETPFKFFQRSIEHRSFSYDTDAIHQDGNFLIFRSQSPDRLFVGDVDYGRSNSAFARQSIKCGFVQVNRHRIGTLTIKSRGYRPADPLTTGANDTSLTFQPWQSALPVVLTGVSAISTVHEQDLSGNVATIGSGEIADSVSDLRGAGVAYEGWP